KEINKAILASDIGITPSDDGQTVRLVFPELTGERRQELVKQIKKDAEGAKVAVRNIRRDAMETIKKLQKNSEITEDDQKEAEERIQKMTDKFIKQIDEDVDKKTVEVTTV
ncbi:MAG: ribosome recycling factor, partial [Lachnospiraceae bacterium]|nr:ribosome recycling factor [Lachnospiraceae bacterium]